MALTDTEIKRAQPQAKSYRLADSGGLSLEVSPAGGKLFRWKYRFERKEKLPFGWMKSEPVTHRETLLG